MDEKTLNEVSNELKEISESNEDIQAVRDLSERAENYVPEEDLVKKEATFSIDEDGNTVYATDIDDPISIDEDATLDDILENAVEEDLKSDKFKDNLKNKITEDMQLSDEEASKMLDCILTYKKDKNVDLYSHMPDAIKAYVDKMYASVVKEGTTITKKQISRMIVDQFLVEAEKDKQFIDLEKALNKAMQIPSMTDMYSEHLKDTMDVKLNSMADVIEDEDPEKAKMLRTVAKRFTWSITFADLKRQYDESARIRKAVRRDWDKVEKSAETVNFINKDSKFRMPDAKDVLNTLIKVLQDRDDITLTDIKKFMTLLFKSIDEYREPIITNTSYIYYLMKNISMLAYRNDSVTNSFSGELISNIIIMIYYIRTKESEFYANSSSTDGRSSKKRKLSNSNK